MPETLAVEPYDVHNQFLVRNVHPPDWTMEAKRIQDWRLSSAGYDDRKKRAAPSRP